MKITAHVHQMNIHVLVVDVLIELNYVMEWLIVQKAMMKLIQIALVSFIL
jgi:hypothetical protein